MSKLHLLKVPADTEARCEATLKRVRALTAREPTLQDKNDCRRILGLPPLTE